MAKEAGSSTLGGLLFRDISKQRLLCSPNKKQESGRSVHSRTIGGIVGPFLLALASVLGHFCFFTYLHEKWADDETLRQSYATNISLLFVTIFRLSIVACVGLCFAQHLWHVLRQHALPLARIEHLFTIRTKPLALANPRLLWATPILFFMAIYLWGLEVAAVYPPGALRVTLKPAPFTTEMTVPVINPPIEMPALFENNNASWSQNLTSSLLFHTVTAKEQNGDNHHWQSTYNNPIRSLAALTSSILSSGRIVDLSPPVGGNVSYNLQFRGPHVSCTENTRQLTVKMKEPFNSTVFSSSWDNSTGTYSLRRRNYLGYYTNDLTYMFATPRMGPVNRNFSVMFAAEQKDMTCQLTSVQYNLNISYVNGFQHISYRVEDAQLLSRLYNGDFFWNDIPGAENFHDFKNWQSDIKSALESWNIFSIADAALANLNRRWNIYNGGRDINTSHWGAPMSPLSNPRKWKLDDGTVVDLYPSVYSTHMWRDTDSSRVDVLDRDPLILQETIFNKQRYEQSPKTLRANLDIDEDIQKRARPYYDARDLNITEASLNEFLTNVTISVLSLGVQRGNVNITISNNRNTYEFTNKLNFFLPYSLCLGVALIFVFIGIRGLILNEVPAADGGFLQIMMATRGRTKMEELVLKEGLVGTSDLSKELLKLKVRFGELVDEHARTSAPTYEVPRPDSSSQVPEGVLTPNSGDASSASTQASTLVIDTDATVTTEVSGTEYPRVETVASRRIIGFGMAEETIPLRRRGKTAV